MFNEQRNAIIMKKSIISIIGFFIAGFCLAQSNFPFPKDNPFWMENSSEKWACTPPGSGCHGYICNCLSPVYYKSDTTINGTNYNRLYSRGVCTGIAADQPEPGCPSSFHYQNEESLYAIIRQDPENQIVYIRQDGQDQILYDFGNMAVGNPYPKTVTNINTTDTLIVASIDSIEAGGISRKRWNLAFQYNGSVFNEGFASIIGGIGSTLGHLGYLEMPFETTYRLECFSLNDESIYPDGSYLCDKTLGAEKTIIRNNKISISPNPAKDKICIRIEAQHFVAGKIRIFDLSGRIVYQNKIFLPNNELSIQHLNAGIYCIEVKTENAHFTEKLIKF